MQVTGKVLLWVVFGVMLLLLISVLAVVCAGPSNTTEGPIIEGPITETPR